MNTLLKEKQFRIFLDDTKIRYYLLTNNDANVTEKGKMLSCTLNQNLVNAAINVPVKTYNITAKFFSSSIENFDNYIMSLPLGKEVWEYNPQMYLGVIDFYPTKCWYLSSISKVGKNTYEFLLIDEISINQNIQGYGSLFNGESLYNAIRKLTNYSIEVEINENIGNIGVNGFYAPKTIFDNLQQIALNYNLFLEYYAKDDFTKILYVGNSDYPTHQFTNPYNFNNYKLSKAQIFNVPTLQNEQEYYGLKITAHNFQIDVSQEENELFNSIVNPHQLEILGNQYYGEIVYLDKPYSNIRIVNGRQLNFSSEGFIIFNGIDFTQQTIIYGIPYKDNTTLFSEGEDTPQAKVIDSIYSIHPTTLSGITDNLFKYYNALPNSEFTVHTERDFLNIGKDIIVVNEFNEEKTERVVNISTEFTLTDTVVSNVETIASYTETPPIPEKTLLRIEITRLPDKLQYFYNDRIDTTGMEVVAYWDDDTTSIVDDYTIFPNDLIEIGTQTVTVYYSKNAIVATDTFTIRVNYAINDLFIDTPPNKVVYYQGQHVDYTGLTAHLSYIGSTEIIMLQLEDLIVQDFVFPEEDISDQKLYQLPVSYYDEYSGNTYTKYITVYQADIGELLSIEKVKDPDYLEYYEGDIFNPYGMVVIAKFSSGVEKILDDEYQIDRTPLTTADTTTTVTYTFKQTDYTWNYDIKVYSPNYELLLNQTVYAGLPIPCDVQVYLENNAHHRITPNSVSIIREQNQQSAWEYHAIDNFGGYNHNVSLTKVVTPINPLINATGLYEVDTNNYRAFYNKYTNYLNVARDENNKVQLFQHTLTFNGQNFDTTPQQEVNITVVDDMPTGTYKTFLSNMTSPNNQSAYIPVALFYSSSFDSGSYLTDSNIQVYTRIITPLENVSSLTYENLLSLKEEIYTEEELLSKGCKYHPYLALNYSQESDFIEIDTISFESTLDDATLNRDLVICSLYYAPSFSLNGVQYQSLHSYLVTYERELTYCSSNLNIDLCNKVIAPNFLYRVQTKPDLDGNTKIINIPATILEGKILTKVTTYPAGTVVDVGAEEDGIAYSYNVSATISNGKYSFSASPVSKAYTFASSGRAFGLVIKPEVNNTVLQQFQNVGYVNFVKGHSSIINASDTEWANYITNTIIQSQDITQNSSGYTFFINGGSSFDGTDWSGDKNNTAWRKWGCYNHRGYCMSDSTGFYNVFPHIYLTVYEPRPTILLLQGVKTGILLGRRTNSKLVENSGYAFTDYTSREGDVYYGQAFSTSTAKVVIGAINKVRYYFNGTVPTSFTLERGTNKNNLFSLLNDLNPYITNSGEIQPVEPKIYIADGKFGNDAWVGRREFDSVRENLILDLDGTYNINNVFDKTITNIELELSETVKTNYQIGDSIDVSGVEVKVSYADGSTVSYSECSPIPLYTGYPTGYRQLSTGFMAFGDTRNAGKHYVYIYFYVQGEEIRLDYPMYYEINVTP